AAARGARATLAVGFKLAPWRAAVTHVDVHAVVAGFAALNDAVATDRLVAAGVVTFPAELAMARRVAAVSRRRVAVVAVLLPSLDAIRANGHTRGTLPRTFVARLNVARGSAAVPVSDVLVVALFSAADTAITAGHRVGAACAR